MVQETNDGFGITRSELQILARKNTAFYIAEKDLEPKKTTRDQFVLTYTPEDEEATNDFKRLCRNCDLPLILL
jgi:hypothetical protein